MFVYKFYRNFIVVFLLSLSSSIGVFIETWFIEFAVRDLNYSFIVSTVLCHHCSLEWLAKKQVALFSLVQNLILMGGFEPVRVQTDKSYHESLNIFCSEFFFFNPFKLVLCQLTVVSSVTSKSTFEESCFYFPNYMSQCLVSNFGLHHVCVA